MQRLKSGCVLVVLLAGSAITNASPRKVLSLRYPVSFREVSKTQALAIGASAIEVDTSKADLELIVWTLTKAHALEVNIDVSKVNQAILPTDPSGKLLSKVTELSAVPWIKVYWPGEAPKILDVTCIDQRKICQGLWKDFPYDPSQERSLKIEANLRGLEGKSWSPVVDTHRLLPTGASELGLNTSVLHPMYKVKPHAEAARVRVSAFYDLMRLPAAFAHLKLLSVYEWSFLNDSTLRETGFFRSLHRTLFQVDHGQFLLETLSQATLQTRDLLNGQAFFADPGTILSFASRSTRDAQKARFEPLSSNDESGIKNP
jgi:hypothetical protein